jgi:peptidase M28-like protein
VQVADLAPSRPPCSVAEREAADAVAQRFALASLEPELETLRAPTSPTWAPLLRAVLRLWAAAFLAAGRPVPAAVLGGVAVVGGVRFVGGLLRFVPLLGATTHNVVARTIGTNLNARPVVCSAHLDTHPAAGAPMSRSHVAIAAVSGWLVFAIALTGQPWIGGWRPLAGAVAAESLTTLVWLARRELAAPKDPVDDNTSGLIALVRLAQLVTTVPVPRDVWLVASGAGTSGSYGVTAFLRRRPELRRAWVIEIDALGSGEVVASPFAARFPRPGTPAQLVRAVMSAAQENGDPMSVRRQRRAHSDARAALRLRVPAIAITAGLHAPAGGRGPDSANAERAARLIERVARVAS